LSWSTSSTDRNTFCPRLMMVAIGTLADSNVSLRSGWLRAWRSSPYVMPA
jgi:hypothetical protein